MCGVGILGGGKVHGGHAPTPGIKVTLHLKSPEVKEDIVNGEAGYNMGTPS